MMINKWIYCVVFLFLNTFYFSENVYAKKNEVVVFEEWYQITLNNKEKIAYYSDKVTRVGDQLQFKHSMWKKENEPTKEASAEKTSTLNQNREVISALAKDSKNLEPDTFNMFESFGENTASIDGKFEKETMIKVITKENKGASKTVSLQVKPKTIFSVFFPLWISKRIDDINKDPISINVFIEGSKEKGAYQDSAVATLLPQDAFGKEKQATKFMIHFLGQKSTWWIKSNGSIEKIEMPDRNIVVNKVSAAEALKTFN